MTTVFQKSSDQNAPTAPSVAFLGRVYGANVYGDRIMWESAIQVCARDFVSAGSDVLDVGANIGGLAISFSRMTGPGGRVHAFEPNPYVLPRLRADISANKCANVIVVPCAAWSRSGERLTFSCEDSFYSAGSRVIEPHTDLRHVSVIVDSITLDDHVRSAQLKPVLVKLDVEGFEGTVITGARETIDKFRPVVIFEHRPLVSGVVNPADQLSELEYVLMDVNTYRRLDEIDFEFATVDTIVNVLAIPREKFVRSKYCSVSREIVYQQGFHSAGDVSIDVPIPEAGRYVVSFHMDGHSQSVASVEVTGLRSGRHAFFEAALQYLCDGPRLCNCLSELGQAEVLRCAFHPREEGRLIDLNVQRVCFGGPGVNDRSTIYPIG